MNVFSVSKRSSAFTDFSLQSNDKATGVHSVASNYHLLNSVVNCAGTEEHLLLMNLLPCFRSMYFTIS